MVASTLKIDAGEASKILSQLNRHMMIVGASRGLGRALATRLADSDDNLKITVASRSYNALSGLRMELGTHRCHATRLDLRDTESILDAVHSTVDMFGPPTGLIITAGSHKPTRLDDLGDRGRERFEEVLRVNLTGPYFLAQLVADHMDRGASIVFVGNRKAGGGMPGRHAHAVSKHGLEALTRGMAQDLGRAGIRVNMVLPDLTETELGTTLIAERANRSGVDADRVRKRLKSTHALRRLAKPDEIAEVIEFLLSPASSAITGQALDVTCGVVG